MRSDHTIQTTGCTEAQASLSSMTPDSRACNGIEPEVHQTEGSGLGNDHVLLEDVLPDHDVHESRLVFQCHEDHPVGRTGTLPADHNAGVADPPPVLHAADTARIGQAVSGEFLAQVNKRMAPRTVPGCPIIPVDGFECAEGCKLRIWSTTNERKFRCSQAVEAAYLP